MGAKKIDIINNSTSSQKALAISAQRVSKIDKAVSSHLVDILSNSTDNGDEGSKNSPSGLTYGHTVLTNVVFERYDLALKNLDEIMEIEKKFPTFGATAKRYITHSKSLVKAMKSKREIGKLPQISKSKQKELLNMLGRHFEDLKACVINIEKIERQVRRTDLSSTRIFVICCYWAAVGVLSSAFLFFDFQDYAYSVHQWSSEVVSQAILRVVNLIWTI